MIVLPSRSPPATFMPARHQVLEHLVDGVLVEQPLVDRLGLDPVGDVAVLVPLQRVPLVLLLFGQIVVPDALALELQRHRDGLAAARGSRRLPPRRASRRRSARRSRDRTGRRCCGRPRPSASRSGRRAASRSSRRSRGTSGRPSGAPRR